MVATRAARVAALRGAAGSAGAGASGLGGGGEPLELRGSDGACAGVEPAAEEDTQGLERLIARALRAKRPDLGEDPGEEAGAPYLAASLLAYASEKAPGTAAGWRRVLAEVLSDASVVLDEDENEEAVSWVIDELRRKGVLVRPTPRIEPGAVVLALLTEDDDWHEAVVQQEISESSFRIMFLEYGKPQDTSAANIRPMDTVVDDDGTEESLQEGKCEMCGRQKLLTFHHLIPKDVHHTYLKKRLPPGIEGEPSRGFLNSYGTMVCRQCHSFVHRLAPNDVLAKEYNTLEKILEHASVKRWVAWAGQCHRSIY